MTSLLLLTLTPPANAARFTREGRITLGAGWTADEETLRITIHDTGIAIAAAEHRDQRTA